MQPACFPEAGCKPAPHLRSQAMLTRRAMIHSLGGGMPKRSRMVGATGFTGSESSPLPEEGGEGEGACELEDEEVCGGPSP